MTAVIKNKLNYTILCRLVNK